MNFPVGVVSIKGSLPKDLVDLVTQLNQRLLNGYIVLSIKAHYIEEGALLFKEGEMVASFVECMALGKSLKGREAFDAFLSQTKTNGFFQVVELTRSQVDLVTAFDEKLLLGSKIALKDLPKLIPNSFVSRFERSEKERSLLDAYGLGELKKF